MPSISMDFLNFLLFLFSIIWIYTIFKTSKSSNLPPGPYQFPIIGNILVLGSKPHRSLAKLSKKYGPVMSLKLGSLTTIIISTPETAKIVLQTHDLAFSSRTIPTAIHSVEHDKFSMAWLPVNTQWRKLRKICKEQMFSVPRLDASQGLRMEKLQKLFEYVKQCCEMGWAVDIGRAAFTTPLNLMSATLFSVEFAQFNSDSSQEMRDVVWGVMKNVGSPNLADYFPILKRADPQGILRETTVCFEKLFAIFDRIIDEKLKSRGESNDLLEALIDLHERDELNRNDIKHLLLWRNFLGDSNDELDQMMLMLLTHEEMRLQAAQSSSNTTHTRRFLNRDREAGHDRLVTDYFSDHPIYPAELFRRRFRMRKELFLRIVSAVQNHSEYFQQRVDAARRKGLSPLQKCTAAIRQLAYGSPADICDEYIRIGETTAIECLFNFCRCVIEVFGGYYLRKPNAADIQRLLEMHEHRHGFPGMMGSLDCMHWEWKNCPVAWKGQFTRGDYGVPTIVLEAVASADLWIWHAFFGVAGSRNDISVLNESPLFNNVLQGNAPEVNFTVNDTSYTKGYYLTDGIYPEWATFVKSFPCPEDPKRKLFKQRQEAARKDVERAFGVLQARWAMIRGPSRFWYKNNLRDIMYTCIILHNMIIEDEGDAVLNWSDEEVVHPTEIFQGSTHEFQEYLRHNSAIRDTQVHHQLRSDLVEHIWAKFSYDQ